MCSDSSCGLVIKGELYYGSTKSAGELNINPPQQGDPCEDKKCWASYDHGCCMRSRGLDLGIPDGVRSFIENHPEEGTVIIDLAGGDPDNINFNVVIEAAEKGDVLGKKILEDAGDYLGTKIAYLINLFNPEVVVIGRGVEKAGDIFFTAIRKAVRKWAYEESVKIVKIVPTSLGDETVAIGAGALVVQDLFANA